MVHMAEEMAKGSLAAKVYHKFHRDQIMNLCYRKTLTNTSGLPKE